MRPGTPTINYIESLVGTGMGGLAIFVRVLVMRLVAVIKFHGKYKEMSSPLGGVLGRCADFYGGIHRSGECVSLLLLSAVADLCQGWIDCFITVRLS